MRYVLQVKLKETACTDCYRMLKNVLTYCLAYHTQKSQNCFRDAAMQLMV